MAFCACYVAESNVGAKAAWIICKLMEAHMHKGYCCEWDETQRSLYLIAGRLSQREAGRIAHLVRLLLQMPARVISVTCAQLASQNLSSRYFCLQKVVAKLIMSILILKCAHQIWGD